MLIADGVGRADVEIELERVYRMSELMRALSAAAVRA
jgi:hypothetical protein